MHKMKARVLHVLLYPSIHCRIDIVLGRTTLFKIQRSLLGKQIVAIPAIYDDRHNAYVDKGRRRRADSTRAGITNSGAEQEAGWSNCHLQHTRANPRLYLVVDFGPELQTVKVVFCDNLPSAAPSVRRTESAARLS